MDQAVMKNADEKFCSDCGSVITNLSESIVIDMIKYVYEMQENDRRPQAWASRVAGDAATSNQGHP